MADDRDHRVVVIGGGVIGLATAAAALRRSPEASVTVLEKASVGGGASAYAGTIDIPYCNTERHRRLVEASWAWHEACGAAAAEYRRPVPITWYAEPGDAGSKLRRSVLPPLSPARPGDAPEWRAPEGVEEHRGRAFVIDCPAWCRALAREVVQSGRGRIVEQAAVVAIADNPAEEGGAATAVKCAGGRVYAAGHVIVCLGPWLPGWSAAAESWAGARRLRTKRVAGLNINFDVHSGRRPQHAVAWPSQDLHFHPAFDGSGYRMSFRHPEWDVDPDQPATLAGADLEPVNRFLDRLLGAGRWAVSGHRAFADTYTPDFTPVVERCPALGKNVTVVTGTHGSGVRLAPGLAELAAGEALAGLGLPAACSATTVGDPAW
jgi:glycine/D-amino acid oxidase-like deaminating enzyme